MKRKIRRKRENRRGESRRRSQAETTAITGVYGMVPAKEARGRDDAEAGRT